MDFNKQRFNYAIVKKYMNILIIIILTLIVWINIFFLLKVLSMLLFLCSILFLLETFLTSFFIHKTMSTIKLITLGNIIVIRAYPNGGKKFGRCFVFRTKYLIFMGKL